MRPGGPGAPDEDGTGRRDLAYRMLATVVAAMRPGRRDWGQAMLAELDHVRAPSERAWFAIGAARVALFPPRATRPWWAVPLGLAIRAVVSGAAIHALAPAAGPAAAVLTALPAAGAWGMLTMPALAARHGGAVLAAQVMVTAGVMGCLVLTLTTVQRYPQLMSMGADHGWATGAALDVASAGYLGVAWLLPRRVPATPRNSVYALAAGLAAAAAAAYYIVHPSLVGLWKGPMPGMMAYVVTGLALLVAAALASIRRGRLADGLETAVWATLLAGLITSIMIIAATSRVAPSAQGSRQIAADARLHGVPSATLWLAGDNLGAAIFSLIWMPAIFLALAGSGAIIGCALRATTRGPGRGSPQTEGPPAD